MRTALLAPVVALSSIVLACDSPETSVDVGDGGFRPEVEAGRGGRSGRGGTGGSGGAGGMGGTAGQSLPDAGPMTTDPRAPQVVMVAPAAAEDPNEDDIITSTSVRVRCRVTKSLEPDARNVNQSSITIRLIGSGNPDQMPVMGSVVAMAENEFEAEFSLASLPNGPLRFDCSASDVSMPALTATAVVQTFLDLGPKLTIVAPADASRHALKNPVLIRFEIEPAPVSSDDEEAAVTDMRLTVLGREFEPTEDPDQPGLFTFNVNFDDRTLFAMPPSTAEIVVTAASSRTPTAPTRRRDANIDIDASGPAITVTGPPHLSIVRGNINLAVTVTDPSGIENGSLVGTINQGQFALDDWDQTGPTTFQTRFDTRAELFENRVQLTINIWANDTVGNRSVVAEHVLRLDNVAPVLSLDPPHVREYHTANNTTLCSVAFDPVGDDAADDEETVFESSLYRVMVFERTNTSSGANYNYHAGVNAATMTLFAQSAAHGVPLVVDADGDDENRCDAILEVPDGAPAPVAIPLSPVNPGNIAYYSSMPDFMSSEHTAAAYCVAGTSTTPPGRQCAATGITRVIPQPLDGGPPAIYGFAPSNANTGACHGNTWELEASLGEGWACVAARVADNIGNVGVSKPIRVCIDDLTGDPPDCPLPAPGCTDDCVADEFATDMMLLRR